jgi:hypothetical protein
MTEPRDRLAQERAEIAARVARFRTTQKKFQRERQQYCNNGVGECDQRSRAVTLALKRACEAREEKSYEAKNTKKVDTKKTSMIG